MTLFLRVLDAGVDEKAQALQAAVRGDGAVFEVEPSAFAQVPGSPFAYWVRPGTRQAFVSLPPFQDQRRAAVFGASTKDDKRYLRLWFEIPSGRLISSRSASRASPWVPLAKGGAFSPGYADIHLVVNWFNDGREVKADISEYRGSRGWGYHWTAALNGHADFFRPGLTWPRRTQSGLGLRVMPAGCIFADKGPAAFIDGDVAGDLLALLTIATSSSFRYLVELQMAFGSYEVGVVQRTPVPDLSPAETIPLAQLARRAWSLKRTLDTVHETSHAFLLPSALRARLGSFDPAAIHAELTRIQAEIDDHAFRLYGLSGDDRTEIERWASRSKSATPSTSEASEDASPEHATEDTDDDSAEDAASTGSERDALLSWSLGVAFGRFDPRLAAGERPMPPEPEPFDPLPTRIPGMWPESEAAPSAHDILVDDPGHAHDLTLEVSACLERVGCSVPEDLRAYFARDFFPLHIKQYSKSRRKAPIYWQLATPSASYSVWLYIHAFSTDTLFRVQNDFVGGDSGKLAHEERRLDALTTELRDGATAAQRKELAAQQSLVEELRAFLDEVKRVAPLWNPNLDDGVLINFAPLHRLVPQHKPWQKELTSTWDALCEGKYDWAHLAMHLWPERVVPKCAKDRSLAIAHGLEDVFWVEGRDGKWTARKAPTKSVDALVKERMSPAVKSALKSLLEAPAASGKSTGRKGGGHRKAATAAEEGVA